MSETRLEQFYNTAVEICDESVVGCIKEKIKMSKFLPHLRDFGYVVEQTNLNGWILRRGNFELKLCFDGYMELTLNFPGEGCDFSFTAKLFMLDPKVVELLEDLLLKNSEVVN